MSSPIYVGYMKLESVVAGEGELNLGVRNWVTVVRNTRARYWIGTHNEVKKDEGFVGWVLKRRVWAVEEVLNSEKVVGKDG
jgi:hypothetical protein